MRFLLLAGCVLSLGLLAAGCGSSGSSSSTTTTRTTATVPSGRVGNLLEATHCTIGGRAMDVLDVHVVRWGVCPAKDLIQGWEWHRAGRPPGKAFVSWGRTQGSNSGHVVFLKAECPDGSAPDWSGNGTRATWGDDAGIVTNGAHTTIPAIGRVHNGVVATLDEYVRSTYLAQAWVRCKGN